MSLPLNVICVIYRLAFECTIWFQMFGAEVS